MTLLRYNSRRKRLFIWMVMAAFVLLLLYPGHFHLHHIDESTSISHTHAIDYHVTSYTVDHGHDGEVDILESSSSVIDKKSNEQTIFAALLMLLLLFVVTVTSIGYVERILCSLFKHWFKRATPPLRAPPHNV